MNDQLLLERADALVISIVQKLEGLSSGTARDPTVCAIETELMELRALFRQVSRGSGQRAARMRMIGEVATALLRSLSGS